MIVMFRSYHIYAHVTVVFLETGVILWANDAELQLLEYTAKEFIGHNIIEVIIVFDCPCLKK